LVVGGYDYNQIPPVLDTAELYDPAASAWTVTGNLSVPRVAHIATTLLNGKVLIAGGTSGCCSVLSTAELYDPNTNQFKRTANMQAQRSGHIAVRLLDGRVLVAGGSDGNFNIQTSAEIYDPAAGNWTSAGSMNVAPEGGPAILLQSGQVLVIGDNIMFQACQLYDPATGTWSSTGNMVQPRVGRYTATLLQDGRVLVTGGFSPLGPILKSCELYDPVTGSWSETGQMKKLRFGHGAVLLPNGGVLVAGGTSTGDTRRGYPLLTEIYNPYTGLWSKSGHLLAGRIYFSTNVLPDGRVLVASGTTDQGTGITRRCELGTHVTGSIAP